MSLREDVKQLKKEIDNINKQIKEDIISREVIDCSISTYSLYYPLPTKTIYSPSLKARVDSIAKHLGMEFEVIPENINKTEAHVNMTIKSKRNSKGQFIKGVNK